VRETLLRTEAHAVSASSALNRALRGLRQKIDYSRLYPCKVAAQNGDGTLSLVPDDARMKGHGLERVKIRYGLPGFKANVRGGARVRLGFDAGDPSRPFAALWDEDGESSVDSIEFLPHSQQAGVARIGDPVDVFVDPGVPIPVVGTLDGQPFVGEMTLATPLLAVIAGGNDSLRA